MDAATLVRTIAGKCRPLTYLFIPSVRLVSRIGGSSQHRQLQQNLDIYCTEEQKQNKTYMRRLKRDMWYSFIVYDCPFYEYFLYQFPRLSHKGRMEFFTEYGQTRLSKKYSTAHSQDLMRDKWKTYQHFREFFRRDMMPVEEGTTADGLAAFAASHPKLVIKPRGRLRGEGVRMVDAAALPPMEELREQNVVLEEPIVQCDFMARLHPASVNTVRVATAVKDGQVHILFATLRMGRGGAFVDNAGAGGFAAAIDIDTGVVRTPGVSETFDYAVIHPDSGAQIVGIHIPRWEELKAISKKLAMVVPEQRYVGWDMALTDDGWVVIEGNHDGQLLTQYITQEGMHEYLHKYLDI